MKLKKTLSALLGFLLLAASAAQAQYIYTTNADGLSITITGYTGPGGDVILPNQIPETTNGLPVTGIGNSAFHKSAGLTSVTIPGSVTSIGADAFGYCVNLTAITVDSNNSFYCDVGGVLFNQSRTTLVQYPAGLAGGYTVPNSVTDIGEYAFDAARSDQRHDSRQCYQHRGVCVLWLPGLASVTIPGTRHQHRG